MSDISLSVEDKLEFERLKEKHKDVFENEDVRAIAYWEDPIHKLGGPGPSTSEKEYLARAIKSIKGLRDYFERVLN